MALAVGPEERNEEKEHEREEREADDDDRFRRRRDQREHREVPEEVPVGAGVGNDVGGVRRLPELGRPEDRREHEDDRYRGGGDDRVAPRGIRPEGDSPREHRFVSGAVRPPVDDDAGNRRLRDPTFHDEIEMQPDQAEDRRRDQENVRRVEAREGRTSDIGPRDDEAREPAADHRCARGLLGSDNDGPESILVPPEELTRERHGERREEEERSGEPVRLTGELERAEEIDLRHVREDEDHHRAGAEVVHSADDRAEGRTVTDELQRVVRRVGRRHVGHREADAGDDLHHKYPEGGAAEDVPPSDGALELAGHGMTQHRHDAVLELEAFAKPARDAAGELREGAQQPHPCFTVGSGCCRTSSRSPLTCHSRSKSRRGGGPPATEPSL